MRTRHRSMPSLLGCALTLAVAFPIHAGVIGGVASVSGGGNAVVDPILTPDPNNDNATGPFESNVASISALFDAAEPIDIVFDVDDSQGVTEYQVVGGIGNSSGFDWIAFTWELGFGTGAGFFRSTSGDGLDFDHPGLDPAPTSARFATVNHAEDFLEFSDGMIADGDVDSATFSIDLPDFNENLMPASAQTANGYRFTLRQTPVVPEPSVLLLAPLGCLILKRSRR